MTVTSASVSHYAPGFAIEINNSMLEANISQTILSVSVEQRLNESNTFRFEVQDEFRGGQFKWLGHALFKLGNDVSIEMGYSNRKQKMLEGKIQTISANFFEGSAPTFTVEGSDSAYDFLTATGAAATFKERSASDIVRDIAGMAGLDAVVDSTGSTAPVRTKRAGESYLDYIKRLGKSTARELVLSGRAIEFRETGRSSDSVATLRWERELLQFRPTMDASAAVTEVIVRGWDPTTKQPIEACVRAGDEATQESGRQPASEVAQEIFGTVQRVIADRPVQSTEEAQQIAQSELDGASGGFVSGSAEIVGLPELHPGQCVELDGIGEWFSGRDDIDQASHRIDSGGYRTTLELKRNAL